MARQTRIFYASDIHGSDLVFKKFINAASVYGADILILGGDLTGKAIVPIVRKPSGTFEADYLGRRITMSSESEVRALEQRIRDSGLYPYLADPHEVEELRSSEKKLEELFSKLVRESLERWLDLAERRLRNTRVKLYMMPGNDDLPVVEEILSKPGIAINPEGKVVSIDDRHEMISTGHANITPWRAPRDIPEEELARIIEEMASRVNDMRRAVFNLHCPPHGTALDLAPKLDENLKPVVSAGGFVMEHAGCRAVRSAIEKYQPLLSLHGHIHESRGVDRIGRTIMLNPGSEYSEGVLRGALVVIEDDKVKSYLLTSG